MQLFYSVLGLQLNPDKTEVFFSSSVLQATRDEGCAELGFKEGTLPVRYLGVPLISSRLSARDCEVLIAKITTRISGWRVRTLSYAGRLQLVVSVLSSIHAYWASVFIIPLSVSKEIEKIDVRADAETLRYKVIIDLPCFFLDWQP